MNEALVRQLAALVERGLVEESSLDTFTQWTPESIALGDPDRLVVVREWHVTREERDAISVAVFGEV